MGSSKLGKVLEGCLFGLRVYLSTLTSTLTFVFDMSRQGCKEVILWRHRARRAWSPSGQRLKRLHVRNSRIEKKERLTLNREHVWLPCAYPDETRISIDSETGGYQFQYICKYHVHDYTVERKAAPPCSRLSRCSSPPALRCRRSPGPTVTIDSSSLCSCQTCGQWRSAQLAARSKPRHPLTHRPER